MGSRYSVHGGQVPEGSWTFRSGRTWPEKPAGPRPRAASPAQRSTPGRGPGLDAHPRRSRPSRGRRLWAVRSPRLRAGQSQATARTPARSGLSGRSRPAEDSGAGGWLQRRVHPTSATSSPRCPAAPTPPYFQRRLSPVDSKSEQRLGPPAGGRCGHREFSPAEGKRCNPRLPPHPPQCTPLVYLGQEAKRREGEGVSRTQTRMRPRRYLVGRFVLTPEPSQDASGEDSTIPRLP